MPKKRKKQQRTIFDAYQYADKFEKLSLEIVKLIYKDSFDGSEVVYGETTQKTRDYGVDAYLVVNFKERLKTYTIEAKLRTSDSLSLKEFATSILYYLINTSSKHFIVTNVSYSQEAIKYIWQSNLRNEKLIELIDGKLLQDIINSNLKQFYEYPQELIDYILNRKCKDSVLLEHISQQLSEKSYIELPYYNALLEDIHLHFQLGYNFFIITGIYGTGKSTWIKYCVDHIWKNYTVHKLDISLIQTPKLFVLEILRLLLGFNVEKLFADLLKEKDMINDITEQFQVFPCDSEQIINALRILMLSEDDDQKSYVYFMHLLIEHLNENFLVNMNSVIIIENLHETTADMIDFVIQSMYCMSHKNIIVFWEILIPQNCSQLNYVSMEQWYNFLYLLTSKNLCQGTLPYQISLDGLLENDQYGELEETIKSLLIQYIPDIAFTSEFVQIFIKYFGVNIRNIFNALNIIKLKNLYSAAAIKDLYINSPIIVEKQIVNLLSEQTEKSRFYQSVFNFVYLMDGKLQSVILRHLDATFTIDSKITLIDSGLFYFENNILHFQYYSMIISLRKYFNLNIQKDCAKWLSEHLAELDINYIDRKYYEIFLLYTISPIDAISKMDEAIKFLYNNKIYKYVLSLSKIRYKYYKSTYEEILFYQYFVKYISYLKSFTSDLKIITTNIKVAESLRTRLAIQYKDDKRYIQTNIKLALVQYHVSKVNYDYDDCEKRIQYILSFENAFDEMEIFIIARIYHALIKKEQGFRKEFVLELIENFQKFPENPDVKVTYYVNMAAMYKFTNKQIAIKLLKTAKDLTFDHQKGYGDLEVEINLLHLYCQETNGILLKNIEFIRFAAEKINSMYILAKTFNLEAYYYIQNSYGKEKAIIQCLKSAIFHSLSNGQTKQAFLFGLNLIAILTLCKQDCEEEFNSVFNWYNKNEIIINRLKRNPYRRNDHMFSALASLLCIAKSIGKSYAKEKILKSFPEFINMTKKEIFDQVPAYYKVKYRKQASKDRNIIFLLY